MLILQVWSHVQVKNFKVLIDIDVTSCVQFVSESGDVDKISAGVKTVEDIYFKAVQTFFLLLLFIYVSEKECLYALFLSAKGKS